MCKVDLLPHNIEAYSKIEDAIKQGKTKLAISHATGTGKSYLIAKLCEDYKSKKVLIVVPSLYIKNHLEKLLIKHDVENTDILLYQKLIKMSDEDIVNLECDIIILDEYHHTTAKVWGKKVKTLIDSHDNTIVFGTSATPMRMDGINTIDEVFEGNCVSELPLSQAIGKGIVPMPKYVAALYTLDYELETLRRKIEKSRNSDEEKKEFYKKINTMRSQVEKSYGMPIILNKHIENRTGKYIVFCRNKKHLEEIKDTVIEWFKVAGIKNINSYTVYSTYEEKDKDFIAFCEDDSDNLKLLFCIDMLNEGLHLENITGVLLLRPTNSHIIFNQQIGRVIETSNNEKPIIFDAVNNFSSVGYGIKLFEDIKKEMLFPTNKNEIKEFTTLDIDAFFVSEYVQDVEQMFTNIENNIKSIAIPWEQWEIDVLKEKYPIQGADIEELKHKNKTAIISKASSLKIKHPSRWQQWEIDILKEKYPTQGPDIEELKYKSKSAIIHKAQNLKIKRANKWQQWEIDILKEKYPTQGPDIEELKHKNKTAIKDKAHYLKIKQKHIEKWQQWELDILKEKYPTQGPDIEELKHRTKIAIRGMAKKMKVQGNSSEKKWFSGKKWQPLEIEILKEKYASEGPYIKELSYRTAKSIEGKAHKLNLTYEKYKWQPWEVEILKEKYPTHGYKIDTLKHRSKPSIVNMASNLGLKVEKRKVKEYE